MTSERLLVVNDRERCLYNEEEAINQYLNGVFSRISQQVAPFKESIDWLVVNSNSLTNVMGGSQSFFCDMFSENLKRAGVENKIQSLFILHCGRDQEQTLIRYIEERLCHKIALPLSYLTKNRPCYPYALYQFLRS